MLPLPLNKLTRSWHYLGPSRSFNQKPRAWEIGELKLVVYRDSRGKLIALSGICPHMGAAMANGRVEGDEIVCPFHEWKFGSDGKCTAIPSEGKCPPPDFARLRPFAVEERYGFAFVFNGSDPFPFPEFPEEDIEDFFAVSPVHIEQKGPWYMVGVNSFDTPHLEHVHKRFTIRPSSATYPHPNCAVVNHRYKICDTTLIDRVLRAAFGNEAELTIWVWGGSFLVVKTEYGPFTNYMFNLLEPVGKDESRSILFVLSRGAKKGALFRALRRPLMWFQSFASWRFFQIEADSLVGIDVVPQTLVPSDGMVKEYCEWLSNRSQHA